MLLRLIKKKKKTKKKLPFAPRTSDDVRGDVLRTALGQ